MSEKTVKDLVKDGLTNKDVVYPEKALYENYLRHNANQFFDPKEVKLSHDQTFGISVTPEMLDRRIHNKVELTEYHDNIQVKIHTCLPHQIYLHSLVMKKWEAPKNVCVTFRIRCIRTVPESVTI